MARQLTNNKLTLQKLGQKMDRENGSTSLDNRVGSNYSSTMGKKLDINVAERLHDALQKEGADDAVDIHTTFLLFASAHLLAEIEEGSSTQDLCIGVFNLTASQALDTINQKMASQAQKTG